MNASERNLLLVTAALVMGIAGCGASLTGPGTGTGGSGGMGGMVGTGGIVGSGGEPGTGGIVGTGGELGTGGSGPFGAGGGPAACLKPAPGEVPTEHRVSATACSPTQNQPPRPDGGVASCATSADCATDASYTFYSNCLQGQCSFDACLTDADCGPNSVCACSTDYYGGNAAYHPNVCVPANCHADSDCGAGGYCSPSRAYCGSFQGFYCHTPADTCIDATSDCQSCGENACIYSPAIGSFTCGTSICAG